MLEEVKPGSSLDASLDSVINHFQTVRKITEKLCEPLEVEDFNLQAMAETSPVKWHLAHTTWFFETFILKRYEDNFRPINSRYEYLFNSYYNAVGKQFPRPDRHLLSRPTVKEVFQYRESITQRVLQLLDTENLSQDAISLVVLGINHEQQHQELLLTDLKYNLFQNPLLPAYREPVGKDNSILSKMPSGWIKYQGGLVDIGQQGAGDGFYFDNESPNHQYYLNPFELSSQLVTNGEYIDFIEAGGYDTSSLWLSDGWAVKSGKDWTAPLYWFKKGGSWYHYTLLGVLPVDRNQAVTHVSYYEADAFASWAGARLPTEQEWESVARQTRVEGNFLDSGQLMPGSAAEKLGGKQMFGDVWEWTGSAYNPYPGYTPLAGAVGEYNGKFMANQFVLRGGSCVTSDNHIRSTYRNFFYPEARWQFSGFRLARSL